MKKYLLGLLIVLQSAFGLTLAQADPERLLSLSASEAAMLIQTGEVTSEQLVQTLLEHIERNSHLNAFTLVNKEEALRQARAADAQVNAGATLGPLHGVPLIIKDNMDVAGLPTTAATPTLQNNIAERTAPVVEALIRAGAIVLGKANMHELAFGATGSGSAFGATHNPYNPLLFPGGSSAGTAAAIAARLVPAGLGSDTTGSVRVPAALTGLYGFRPTLGRYSQEGIVPLSHSRDTAGPIARTMADIVLLDSVITGETGELAPVELKGLRLGVPRAFFYETLEKANATLVEAALAKLDAAGVILVEADLPISNLAELDASIFFPTSFYETPRELAAYLDTTNTELSVEEVIAGIASPDVRGLFGFMMSEGKVSDEDYQGALQRQLMLQGAYQSYFTEHEVDAVIFPTTPLSARAIEGSLNATDPSGAPVDLDGTPVGNIIYVRNTSLASSANLPALSLPIGLTPEGLPVGIEIDGLTGEDRKLLAIGLALENVFGHVTSPILPW
jgi:indoleacetamide hydrolase